MFPVYLQLTNGFSETHAIEGTVPSKCLVPLTAHPVFEAVSLNHSQFAAIHRSHNVNTIVRLSIGNDTFTFKVQETIEKISEMINYLANRQ